MAAKASTASPAATEHSDVTLASAASPAATEHIDVTPLSELLNQECKTEPSHQRHATPNHISLLDRRETQVRPAICSCPAGCTYECEYGLSTCWLCDPRNYRPDNGQCCCPCEGCYPDTEPDEDTAATEHSDVTLASAASPAATEHSDVTPPPPPPPEPCFLGSRPQKAQRLVQQAPTSTVTGNNENEYGKAVVPRESPFRLSSGDVLQATLRCNADKQYQKRSVPDVHATEQDPPSHTGSSGPTMPLLCGIGRRIGATGRLIMNTLATASEQSTSHAST